MLENGTDTCSCVKDSCPRFGKCQECMDYHSKQAPPKLVFCKRPENISHKVQ